MQLEKIDHGMGFDWGKTSRDYAKYRDIYPEEFYQYLQKQGIGGKGQRVLDIGTGTGVLPRRMYPWGGRFVGVDVAENQIAEAEKLARQGGMDIEFLCSPAEDLAFPDGTFDCVTACQCFAYFDHEILAPKLYRMLKSGGRLAVLYMAWLPEEDEVAGQSEALVLRYNPAWTGCGETRRPIPIPPVYGKYFELEQRAQFDVEVPFTRQGWNGRIKACRGIGASLSAEESDRFEEEHGALLQRIAPPEFSVLHYVAAAILRKK